MEKLADTVENLLEKTFSLYQELEQVLEQEKIHVVNMDVDSLWKTIARKKHMISSLEMLNIKMHKLLEKRAAELSMDSASFKLPDLIGKLPVSRPVKSRLRRIRLCLETIKKSVSALAVGNKDYINESLSVINGVFSMATDTASKKQYSRSGNLLKRYENNRLINAEV